MPNPDLIAMAFGPDNAPNYDAQFAALRAIKDALHLVTRAQLGPLADDARVLVVGAGTGAEVRFLAPLFPGWRFTLVDPSEAMLAVAKQHAEAEGFADRCRFEAAYLHDTPVVLHDAALSVLVSHFLTDADERLAYFGSIAERLHPGSPLFEASLCADRQSPTFDGVLELWLRLRQQAGPLDRDTFLRNIDTVLAAHGPRQVEQLLERAGFEGVTPCFQLAMIRGWVATAARAHGSPG